MSKPAIITVAITGAVPRKADTLAVPVTPSQGFGVVEHGDVEHLDFRLDAVVEHGPGERNQLRGSRKSDWQNRFNRPVADMVQARRLFDLPAP